MSKKIKTLRLFAFNNDLHSHWAISDVSDKGAEKLWKRDKNRVGETCADYPTLVVESFKTLHKAKKVAKKLAKRWYYVMEFDISVDTIIKMFDGEYGSKGPPCVIKKVHPLKWLS